MTTEQINEERKKQKMSVAELAEKANLPKGTVEKILFGIVKHPRIDTMEAIEKALGLNKPNADDNAPLLTDKEKALLEAFNNMLPETQDFVLRTVQSLQDKKSVT